ncbi:MAG: bacterioferritin [Clostridia bacterium]|nr:bacterioferritin [Clostridia bacterium]
MSNKAKTLEVLQAVITGIEAQSLTHRYESKIFGASGFSKLAEKYADHAAEEKDFADKFIDRLLDLGGELKQNGAEAKPLTDDIEEFLKYDRKVSEDGLKVVNDIMASGDLDVTTYELFVEYLADEEEDLYWSEEQLDLIKLIGKQNYLVKML